MDLQKIGSIAFIVGIIIAVIAGIGATGLLGPLAAWIPLLLVILGLIVGLLNITDKETHKFLIAAAALMLTGTAAASLAVIPVIGVYLASIMLQIAVFVAPAALLVAVKAIWNLASKA
ncbi:MAG: hypothetical protein ABID38_01540 [Candidatus Diapherotrites archaeon]